MTLTIGSLGIDFAGLRPKPSTIFSDGARFILRYSAGVGNKNDNTQFKLCGPTEIHDAVAAGLDFVANSEWYEDRVTEGATAGHADGVADLAFWESRGLNRGASIYVSWDANPNPAQWTAVDNYLRAYDQALGGYYHVDCYGGTPYLKHALATNIIHYGWRTNAPSWNNDGLPYQPAKHGSDLITHAQAVTPAAIWQTGNYWYGKGADECILLKSHIGSHLQAVNLPTPTPSKPTQPTLPKPTLHRAWPLTSGYFGDINGPAESHGGANAWERPHIQALQLRLIATKSVTGVGPSWADGRFEAPTTNAVKRYQVSHNLIVDGRVGPKTWIKLFTY